MTASEGLDDFGGLLNWDNLQQWLREHDIPGSGPITSVRRFTDSGSQNNIFLLERAEAKLVLRRPPAHPRANSNTIMVREARVLASLSGSSVPHPKLYGTCNDLGVIGVCFNVLSFVEGFTPHGRLPGRYASEPEWRRAMAFEMVDAAAALATIDPDRVGLNDFGKPDGWIERQVGRWRSQLDGYQEMDGYRGSELPGVDEIATWLDDHRPSEYRNGLIHGDYQFANVMFAHDQPRIAAIVDWELSTLGDPLLDLGWMLASWDESGDPRGHDVYVEPFGGFPSRAEVSERYLGLTRRDPALVLWYCVLACYKEGILVEGTWARALSGKAPVDVGQRLHQAAMWYFERAAQLISE